MDDDATFSFSLGIPSRTTILRKVEEISGLKGLSLSSEDGESWHIKHPDFTARRFVLYEEPDGLHFHWGWTEKWYLFDVTVAALISLGGRCDYLLPKASYRKWDDVKASYPVVKPGRPEGFEEEF